MKIGIGVTTYNRPGHLKMWHSQNQKYILSDKCVFYKADDSEDRKGIAYRKNECLRALKDCDYVFLFDDDCFPIKNGWAEFFIEASKASGQQHFQYLKKTPMIKCIHVENTIDDVKITSIKCYNNSAGCMMFFTKECIEKVGAYDERFGIYGFEHCQYSDRAHKAGLTPLGAYTCPAGAGEYIYSMDLDNHLSFNKELNHKSSIDIKEGLASIQKNKEIYLQRSEIYIPL